MHLLIFTVLLTGVLASPHEHTALGPPFSVEDVSDNNPPHDDFDSMIPEEIAEKLLSNAISDKEKSSTESDQQDSSTPQLTDRDIIKAIKREQTENPWKFKKDGDKDEITNTMKRYNEWFNNPDRIKRGRNSVFGNQPDKRGRNPGMGNEPGKRKMNSIFGNPPYKRRRNLGIGDDLTRDIMSNPQKRQVNSATEAATLDIKGVTKPCRLSDEEAARAVAVHRAYRKKEYADNMWTMDWNGTLADLAQGLADECTFKHTNLQSPSGVHVGQNLGATTGSDHSIERMVGLYMNEKDNYNYKDHQWIGVVGHYLQVVNWKTIQVGCAMNKCDNLYISTPTQQEVWKNAWYWVCDYWPPVSTKSRPYDSTNGQACSECMVPKGSGLGWKCIDQTCRDCKLDGSDPDCQKSKECTEFNEDKDPMLCPHIALMGMCGGEYLKWSLINCQTSCKLCSTVNDAFVEES